VPLIKAKDPATAKVVKYALVGTVVVPWFHDMEEDAKSTSSPLPDGVVLGEHVVEVVEDPSWGEGLDEAEYALEEPDEDPPSGERHWLSQLNLRPGVDDES